MKTDRRKVTIGMRVSAFISAGLLALAAPALAQTEPAEPAPEAQPSDPISEILVDPEIFEEAVDTAIVRKRYIWSRDQVRQLLAHVEGIAAAGLNPSDYEPKQLHAAIMLEDEQQMSDYVSAIFSRLAVDLRDGRTPDSRRRSWYVRDNDADYLTSNWLLEKALVQDSIGAALEAIEPLHPQYAKLKQALADNDPADIERRQIIRANLERWRWLPRNLGDRYILVNVPAFELQLMEGDTVLRRHKIIVGKKVTPTPQLDVRAQGVIFNPNWYVPQSILREGLGSTIRNNPAAARAKGYAWTISDGGTIYARQLPGPRNALGLMKLDMRNPHSIFIHDTPAKHLFDRDVRTFSHGCIRTHEAARLAGYLAARYASKTPEEIVSIIKSRKTTRVEFARSLPIYISYFTATVDDAGELVLHDDIYRRDRPVIDALDKPVDYHVLPDPVGN